MQFKPVEKYGRHLLLAKKNFPFYGSVHYASLDSKGKKKLKNRLVCRTNVYMYLTRSGCLATFYIEGFVMFFNKCSEIFTVRDRSVSF